MYVSNDHVGSIYGGLGQLLLTYYQHQNLVPPQKLLDIQDLERFDFMIWRELLTHLDQQLQRPALGLEIAALVEPKHLGILAYLVLSCETLADALRRYHDYHRLVYDGIPLQINVDGELLSIAWDKVPYNLGAQITDEIAIALMMEFLKSILDIENIRLHEVHFEHSVTKNVMLYEQYFRCKVRFGQAKTQVLVAVSEMARPLKKGDQTLQHILKQQAEALLEKLPNTNPADYRLQQTILAGLQNNSFQIEHVAQKMNMSVRQLQRHLQQQGKTYQQRMQEIRCMMATEYLKDPDLSLQEIALLLGYSEQSAFQRAFKQWTKMTPQQWKNEKGLVS